MRRKTCARHGKSRWKIVTFRLISSNVPPLLLLVPLLPLRFLFCTRRVCCNHQSATLSTYLPPCYHRSPFLPLFLFLSLYLYLSLTRPSLFSRLSVRAPSLCRDFHFYLRTSVSPRDSTVGSVITYVDVAVHDSVEQQWLGIYSIRSPFRHREFPSRVSRCIYVRIRSPGK